MGGHAEAILERCPHGAASSAWTVTRRPWPCPGSGSPASVTASSAVHAVYDDIADGARRARRGHRDGHPVRPRRLLAAARRAGARLRLPARRAARHADGPVHRHHRRRRAQHLLARRPRPHPEDLRRGAVRRAHRLGGPARAREGAVHQLGPPRRGAARRRARGLAAHRRPPGQAHLPGPAHRGQRRARGLGARRRLGHRGARARWPDRRAVLPLARGPHHQAGVRRAARTAAPRTGCRSSCPSTPPTCDCSPVAPRCPTSRSSTPTPDPPRPGYAPPNVSSHRTEPEHEPARPGAAAAAHQPAPCRADPAPAQGGRAARGARQRRVPRAVRRPPARAASSGC